MRRLRGATTCLVAFWLCAAGVAGADEGAAPPRWSQPRDIAPLGVAAQAGIDDSGKVTVIWQEARDWSGAKLMGATREPGAKRFSAPVELDRSLLFEPTLVVMPGGEIAVLYHQAPCAEQCDYVARLGPDVRRLAPPVPAAPGATHVTVAASPNGRLMLAWRNSDHVMGSVLASERAPGASGFGAPTLLEPVTREGWATGQALSVAVNDRGDAVVGWSREERGGADPPVFPRVAVRAAGGRFGAPIDLGAPAPSSWTPRVALNTEGSALVVFGQGGPVYRLGTGGAFTPAVGLGADRAETMQMATNAEGAAGVLSGRGLFAQDWRIATRPVDGPFDPTRSLDLRDAANPMMGLDPRANALIAWTGAQDGRLRAGAIGRFEPALSERSPPLSAKQILYPRPPAVNASGHAVLAFIDAGPTQGSPEFGAVRLIERAADTSALRLRSGPLRTRGGVVAAKVRCAEPCQASLRLLPPRRAGASVSGRAVLLRRGVAGTVRLRTSARQRRALRRRRVRRVTVELRAVDSWGNRRVIRRKVSAKRLLGRRR